MKDINKKFKQEMIVDTKKQDDEDLASIIDMLKKSTTINKNFSNDILYTWYDVLNTDRIFNEFVSILPEDTYTLVSSNYDGQLSKTLTFIHDDNYMQKLTLKSHSRIKGENVVTYYTLYSNIVILPKRVSGSIDLKSIIRSLAIKCLFDINSINYSPLRTRFIR